MHKKKIKYFFIVSFAIIISSLMPFRAFGQINYSVFTEVTATGGDDHSINDNNRLDNPFNSIRAKIFVNSWLSDNIGVFMKFLVDNGASSSYGDKIRIDGAYFLFNIHPLFNIKVGQIPVPFGSFPRRSYFEKTALIGTPLMYQYRVSLSGTGAPVLSDILSARGTMSGVNIIYEACWPEAIEFFTEYKKIEYMFSISTTSNTNPRAKTNDGYEYSGRIGFNPIMGMRMGIGYSYGPYLTGNASVPTGSKPEDYITSMYTIDFEYSFGYMEFYAEWVHEKFSSDYSGSYTGYADDEFALQSYYIEGKYKIMPRLYAAGRFGQLIFDEVYDPAASQNVRWDYNINRLEAGLGYSINRKLILKGVFQHNSYVDSPLEDVNIYALQLKAEL